MHLHNARTGMLHESACGYLRCEDTTSRYAVQTRCCIQIAILHQICLCGSLICCRSGLASASDDICACICPFACLQTYIQDLANQKAMGIIQVPTAGKFLGLLVTSPPGTLQPKLLALVLNLPQQTQRPSPAQR